MLTGNRAAQRAASSNSSAAAARRARARRGPRGSIRNVECRLPSPACPQLQASRSWRRPISTVAAIASSRRSSGTTMSSLTLPPRWAVTPARPRRASATARRSRAPLRCVDRERAVAEHLDELGVKARRPRLEPSASAMTMKARARGSSPGTAPVSPRAPRVEDTRARGAEAVGEHGEDRRAAARCARVARRDGEGGLGRGDEPQPRRGDDPERALGADRAVTSGRSRRRPCGRAADSISSPGATTASSR